MLTRTATAVVFLGFVLAAWTRAAPPAQNSSRPNLENVLTMMDHAAKGFRSLSADIEHVKYTAVVKDTATETGQIYVQHDGKLRIEFKNPDARTILRTGDSLFIHTPKINRVEEYNLGKNRAIADQYLALGFGTKSESLRKYYTIEIAGEEELDHKKTVLLELTPKSEQDRSQITKVQMWVDESSWLPLQQKFLEAGSGDFFLSHYTNILENLKINPSKFKPDWPKGTKIEKPRG